MWSDVSVVVGEGDVGGGDAVEKDVHLAKGDSVDNLELEKSAK